MKTGKKNLWLIASLCVAFVISMFFGVYSLNGKKAHATVADNTFEMAGAAVRMDGSQGLRFGAIVADNLVEEVEADDKLSFGAFIAPLDWMEYLGITTTYSDSYNYYKNFKEAYAEVSSNTVPHNFHITPYKDNGDGSHELCLTLGGVQYNNMSRTFFGLFCIVNNNGTPSDESDDTFTYARFGDNNKRSYSYVASAALTDTTKNYTSAQKTNLYNVLQLAFYSKNGIEQAKAEANVAAGTYLEYELELNTSAVTLSVGNTYDIKSSLILNEKRVSAKDVLLKYSSSDTDVATVSNSGRITAVANGSATITVTYANPSAGVYYSTKTVSVTVAGAAAKAITSTDKWNSISSIELSNSNKTATVSASDQCNHVSHIALFKIEDMNGKDTISFNIQNNSSTQAWTYVFWFANSNEQYQDGWNIIDGTNSTGGTKVNDKNGYEVTVAANSNADVKIVCSDDFTSATTFRISPWKSRENNGNNLTAASFVLTNISFGAATSGNAVNINSADNGSVTANVANAAADDKVYLTVTPDKGYRLNTLTVKDASNNDVTVQANVFTMPNSAVTVSATFSKVTYSITNKVSDKVTVASSAQYGDKVNISVADSDYYIVSVTYRANGTLTPIYTDSFIMPDSGVIITAAVVSNDYDINLTNAKAYNANEEEITTAKPGEKVTIVANDPATGYVFDKWTSDIELDGDTSTTSFTMDASDVTITATYKDVVVSTTLTVVSAGKINGNMGFVSNTSTEAIYDSKVDYGGQRQHFGYAKVKCTTADVSTITFKIYNQATGNSNNTLTLYAAVRGSISNSNEDFDDNNLKGITSVTGGSVDTDNSRVRAKFNSISMGSSATVSITLAESISQNTEFYITFASMIDGGFVGNFKIEFAEPVYYTVTNSVDTITVDKVKAAEGDTVTLTPIDNTKVVTAFNYTPAGGSATDVSGNTLTMPAKAVTINSVTLEDKPSGPSTPTYKRNYFTQIVGGNGATAGTGNYSVTLTNNSKVELLFNSTPNNSDGHMIKFRIENKNTSNAITIAIGSEGKNGGNVATLTTTLVGDGTINSSNSVTVNAGGTVDLTIEMSRTDWGGFRFLYQPNSDCNVEVSYFYIEKNGTQVGDHES